MHVAIDTTPLSNAHSLRGIGSYTKNLIDALQKYEKKHSYTFFTRGQKIPDTVDLVHYPYFDPFFLTLPIRKTKPTVVTVHDLIPLVFPEKFPPGIKGAFKWQLQKISLMGARRIITDSEQSKIDIHRIIGRGNDRIDVVPLASSPIFRVISDKKKLENIKRKYTLPETFVLYVGDVNWNKNIAGMLKAFSKVKGCCLVLVGKAIKHTALFIKPVKYIKKLGFVPDGDLVGIYNLASAYIQPSFYEGFGLPVLEAMSCGCPVVCSYAGSLKEIGGPAISVDPTDPENIASGISSVLELAADKKQKLVREGLAWAKKFSWEKVAAQTVVSYEKALA